MNKCLLSFSLLLFFYACKDKDVPDVSGIKVNLQVVRFENDFFKIDTTDIQSSIIRLRQQHGNFTNDFLANIMGLLQVSDSSGGSEKAIRQFIRDYMPVKQDVDKTFGNFNAIRDETVKGLQFVKHYFPRYRLPPRLITFIGPMDAYFEGSLGGYGDVITTDALATGLQLHLGSNFPLYHSKMGQALYPTYISKRFAPEYISVNCIKNVIDDLFPDNSASRPLVEQMVEKGKRMYLLDKFMPFTNDTLKTGYTEIQLKGAFKNEGIIWNHFLTNSLVYNSEPGIIKGFIGDSPNTPEFGTGSPGYIGLFTGWQIVKKFMEKNSEMSLQQLMQTDAKKVFEESKYRPR